MVTTNTYYNNRNNIFGLYIKVLLRYYNIIMINEKNLDEKHSYEVSIDFKADDIYISTDNSYSLLGLSLISRD